MSTGEQVEFPDMPGRSEAAIHARIADLISRKTYHHDMIDQIVNEIAELRDMLVDYSPYG